MAGRIRIGEILVNAGVIDQHQLNAALGEQRRWGRPIGQTLVKMGLVEERDLVRALASQLSLPVASLDGKRIGPDVLALVPAEVAEQRMVLPLFVKKSGRRTTLYLAMEDPGDLAVLDDLAFRTGFQVKPVMMSPSELCEGIDRYYRDAKDALPAAGAAPVLQTPAALREVALELLQEETAPGAVQQTALEALKPATEAPPLEVDAPTSGAPALEVDPPVSEAPALEVDPPVSEAPALEIDPPVSEAPALEVDPPMSGAPALEVDPSVSEAAAPGEAGGGTDELVRHFMGGGATFQETVAQLPVSESPARETAEHPPVSESPTPETAAQSPVSESAAPETAAPPSASETAAPPSAPESPAPVQPSDSDASAPVQPSFDESALASPPPRETADGVTAAPLHPPVESLASYDARTRTILHVLTQLLIEQGVISREDFHERVSALAAYDEAAGLEADGD